MRLLMVGELSSAGHFLAMGFRELGVDVTHIAFQNGWRQNPIEINLTSSYKGTFGRLDSYRRAFKSTDYSGYDVVLFLDYFVFPRTFGINTYLTERLKERNNKCFLWMITCDSNFARWGKSENFELCNPCLHYDQRAFSCRLERNERDELKFLEGISSVIPGGYEYFESHKYLENITNPIQVPVCIDEKIKSTKAQQGQASISVFHGLNRYGFKGTFIVQKVFSNLALKYSGNVRFLIKGKVPFSAYQELLNEQTVIVDQLFNKSLGVNSLLALSKGKILVAGDSTLGSRAYGIPPPPMLNADASVNGLQDCLSELLDNIEQHTHLSEAGVEYVRAYHSPRIVASRFLTVFEA